MPYRIAAIDIHKKVLMVVVATTAEEVQDVTGQAMEFECHRFGAGHAERQHIVAWLRERQVYEVVMESTAQYWKPVWLDLEPHFPKLHLAQAQSNKAPKGRKDDFKEAKRLARRLASEELMLSYVPEAEQRTWRTLTRTKQQFVKDRVRLQNQMEAFLEEMRIKLSSVISDLLGVSGRRILTALSKGQTDPVELAKLGDDRLKCSQEELADALRGSPTPMQIEALKVMVEHLESLDRQIEKLNTLVAGEMRKHQDAVARLAQIPGLGVDSAQQLIAEIGVDVAAFPSAEEFCSWIGVCPGSNISAEENHSSRCPKGNRFVRRLLTEGAQAAVKTQGSIFQRVFRKFMPRLKYAGAIWAVAHKLARVIWKLLHDGVDYIEKGEPTNPKARRRRMQKLLKRFRDWGYSVTLTPLQTQPQPATVTPA